LPAKTISGLSVEAADAADLFKPVCIVQQGIVAEHKPVSLHAAALFT
jgi:hypothetical protein